MRDLEGSWEWGRIFHMFLLWDVLLHGDAYLIFQFDK